MAGDDGGGGEELGRLVDGHVQDVGDRLVLVTDLQGLPVVAGAVADLAGDVDVGQEVHLDLERAVALAGLAASALDVEGETPGSVAAHLRLGHGREDLADVVPHAGVGGGIGPRGTSDRRLVHVDHLVQVLHASHRLVPAGYAAGAVEAVGKHLVEDGVDQGGLPRPGYTRDGGEHAKREGDGDVLEVVLPGSDDGDLTVLIPLAPSSGNLDLTPPCQVVTGDGTLGSGQARDVAGVDDLTAQLAGSGPDVDDPVGRADGVLVMLDDDERIAQVPQPLEGLDESGVVALVQADTGLVQDVEDAH